MIDFGKRKPGGTLFVPFATFAGATGAPSAATGLAVGDIAIYKNGGTTERASTSGFVLLDTDGLDFDLKTGINGFSVDLSDNTTAGFYEAGAQYFIVVGDITIDSQTVRFVAATFSIGMQGATLDTTVATLSSQTSFTLTAGPAEDNALNGCVLYFHGIASAVQSGFGVVERYTGSSKTVTMRVGTTFAVTAGDNVSVFPKSNIDSNFKQNQALANVKFQMTLTGTYTPATGKAATITAYVAKGGADFVALADTTFSEVLLSGGGTGLYRVDLSATERDDPMPVFLFKEGACNDQMVSIGAAR